MEEMPPGAPIPPAPQPTILPEVTARDRTYLSEHRNVLAELQGFAAAPKDKEEFDVRWGYVCDAAPRGLLPRSHLPISQTGNLTFATIWEILKFDLIIFMLRGARPLAELTVFRQVCACMRLAIRGTSELGRPAEVPADLEYPTIRAMIAYEDLVPQLMRRHSEHVVLHLVPHIEASDLSLRLAGTASHLPRQGHAHVLVLRQRTILELLRTHDHRPGTPT